jgi:hypothetical protein
MKRDLEVFTAVFALSLTALSPALAEGEWTQLIADAGLTPAEAAGLSLEQITVYKFNRGAGRDNAIGVVARGGPVQADPQAHGHLIHAAGLSRADVDGLTLGEVFAYKADRDNAEDFHPAAADGPGAVDPAAHAQLIASLGLSADDAAGMSFSAVAMRKFKLDGAD